MRIGIIIVFNNNQEALNANHILREKVKYENIELCLINNGSTDDTLDILKDIKETFQSAIEIIDIKKTTSKVVAVRAGERYFKNQGNVKYVGFIDYMQIQNAECLNSILKDIEFNSITVIDYCKTTSIKQKNQSILMNLISLIDYKKNISGGLDFC